MDFQEESKKIEDICLMLHYREVESRKKEQEKFNKMSEEEKEIHEAGKKHKEKIRNSENKRILKSKYYKNKCEKL
jgi:hypothetical protein